MWLIKLLLPLGLHLLVFDGISFVSDFSSTMRFYERAALETAEVITLTNAEGAQMRVLKLPLHSVSGHTLETLPHGFDAPVGEKWPFT